MNDTIALYHDFLRLANGDTTAASNLVLAHAVLAKQPIDTDKDRLLTVEEASVLLRVGTAKVYALVTQGLIKHSKIGRRICFHRTDLDEFLNRSVQGVPGRLLRF